MAGSIQDKRKRMTSLIDTILTDMDPSGVNASKYRKMFQTMSDKQFSDWANEFFSNPKTRIRFDIEEFNEKRSLKYENVEKASKDLKVPLFEYVYIPHVSSNKKRPVRTKTRVLVGYLNIKRVQQLQQKKSTGIITDTDRDEITGIAKGDAKGGRQTGVENQILMGLGGDIILSEIVGTRGDNAVEYDNMLSQIAETGSCRLENIKTSTLDKPTLLKTDLYLKAMGIKTDIVSEAYINLAEIRTRFVE